MVWFRKSAIETSMSSSSPVTSFNFEAKSQEPHKLWEGVFTLNTRPVARGGSGGSQEPPFLRTPLFRKYEPPPPISPHIPPYDPPHISPIAIITGRSREITSKLCNTINHCKPCSNLYHVNNNLWWSSIAYVCGNHGDNATVFITK